MSGVSGSRRWIWWLSFCDLSCSNVNDVVLEPDVRPGGRGSGGLGTASRSLDSGPWIGERENP